jgi:hypothetical protein
MHNQKKLTTLVTQDTGRSQRNQEQKAHATIRKQAHIT